MCANDDWEKNPLLPQDLYLHQQHAAPDIDILPMELHLCPHLWRSQKKPHGRTYHYGSEDHVVLGVSPENSSLLEMTDM